jgi:carboxyl-terminal processing protease
MNFLKSWTILLFIFVWYSIWYLSHNFTSSLFPYTLSITDQTGSILESPKIQEAYSYLERYYYGFHKKTPTEREDAMIDSLTKSLWDKHTSYFNPKDAEEFSSALSGDFEGIGAVIKEHPKGIQVMKVLSGSPASKTVLRKWDIITVIDTKGTVGMSSSDAVELIRGPKWTTVTLTILSWEDVKEVKIQRDTVIVPSVSGDFLTGTTIGYIELAFFGEHTTEEFTDTLGSLIGSGATGIIIDGRNNGGGYLDSAVDVLSTVLPENQLVVATRGINPAENIDYKTKKRKIQNTQIPIIMIVNNMSASATEIVAWALQDYNRALIVGEKTYWKGSVQEPFSLSDGSMMKITIAKWFTPKDRGIDEKWIEPDIDIALTDDDYKNIYDRQSEGAKVLMQYLVDTKKPLADVKKDTTDVKKYLKDKKISD